MAVLPDDMLDAVDKQVRVKLYEQAVPLEGKLLGPVRMLKEGYRAEDTFGVQVGATLRPFQVAHVETLTLL